MAFNDSEYGGAALEYVIVSAFAGVLSLVAIGFVAKIAKDRLSKLSEAVGEDADFDISPLESMGL